MQKLNSWSPLHFLAALGAGGMSVAFLMPLMFWVPHPNRSMPAFDDLVAHAAKGGIGEVLVYSVSAIIAFLLIAHFRLMYFNFRQYQMAKADGRIEKLLGTNAHTQLLAMPLASAMSINGFFIAGSLFIPGLWDVAEYLFPLAVLGFAVLGYWALKLYFGFIAEVFHKKSFKKEMNGSLAQMLPAFTFGMIAVGFAATVVFSHNVALVTFAMAASIFFLVATALVGLLKLVIGFNDLFEHGATPMALPTLWVLIPTITVSSIAVLRLDHGLTHTLLENVQGGNHLVFLTTMFAFQIFIGLMGYAVMRRMGYFQRLVAADKNEINGSPVAFALICPGVAITVMSYFFMNLALVQNGLLVKFSITYFAMLTPVTIIQLLTVWLLFRLVKQQLKGGFKEVSNVAAKTA